MNFTREDLSNILALINKATISGGEAIVVGQLQIKIQQQMAVLEKDEPKKEDKKENKDDKKETK